MKLSNGLFAQAVAWIYENTEVKDQKTLASVTGITETTISRILNDKVKSTSSESIMRLNRAFGGVFNLAYFQGKSVVMLNEDAEFFRLHPEKSPLRHLSNVGKNEAEPIPPWADSLIQLSSDNRAMIEDFKKKEKEIRKEYAYIIADNDNLRKDLRNALESNEHLRASLNSATEDVQHFYNSIHSMFAEMQNLKKEIAALRSENIFLKQEIANVVGEMRGIRPLLKRSTITQTYNLAPDTDIPMAAENQQI